MADVSASVILTDMDTQADALKDLCGISAETIIVLTVGKLITKLQFLPAVVILFPIARFYVCLATRRPVLTADTDFKSKIHRKEFGNV